MFTEVANDVVFFLFNAINRLQIKKLTLIRVKICFYMFQQQPGKTIIIKKIDI